MTDFRTFYLNERTADPTRTLTLRSQWVADWNRRIAALKKVIKKSVVDNDGFALEPQTRLFAQEDLEPARRGQWQYRWTHEKVNGFMDWLREMESRSMLEITQRDTLRPGGEPWSNLYVRSAYQKGLSYALDNIRQRSAELARNLGLDDSDLPPSFRPTGGAVSALMNQPFHADRLALAYTRTFEELKGVTAAMDQQISRILTDSLAKGLNPRVIGKLIADRVEKIGGTRGRLIARTETINIHQQAALNEYYATENATGEVMLVEWNATLDSRTRDTHMERHGRVYTKEEAYSLIGEPNCRCALLPYIPAIQGVPAKATQAAKAAAEKAVEKSELEEKKIEKKPEKKKSGWVPSSSISEFESKMKERFKVEGVVSNYKDDSKALSYLNRIGEEWDDIESRFPGLKKLIDETGRTPVRYIDLLSSNYVKSKDRTFAEYDFDFSKITIASIKSESKLKIGSKNHLVGSSFEDFFRHEFGHGVMDNLFFNSPLKLKWNTVLKEAGGLNSIKTSISSYAGTNKEEAFSEAFSAFTHPDYGKDYRLPKAIEDFFVGLFK